MDFVQTWGLPLLVVIGLALVTLLFAGVIGRWIDGQGSQVVDPPRERRKSYRVEDEGEQTDTRGANKI